jgi:hypothetical protein
MNTLLLIFFILDTSLILLFFWKTVKGYFLLKELINRETAKGKLIFLEQKKQLNKLYYFPVVEFKTSNYKTISFRSEKISGKVFKEDAPLEILYDPYAPNKAVIKGYENGQFRKGLYGTLGFTILNITIAIISLLVKFTL